MEVIGILAKIPVPVFKASRQKKPNNRRQNNVPHLPNPTLPNSKLTILSDKSSGKNFRKPRNQSATHP
jgi:hypothetical protein